MYDVIVIGAGHNGLTTATLLAKWGKRVLVLEQRSDVGGLASSHEFHPGYHSAGLLHDTSLVRHEVVEKLELQKHGLRIQSERAPVTLLSEGGKSITLKHDPNQSAEAIGNVSSRDAEAYKAYQEFIAAVRPWITGLLNAPQPDLANPTYSDLSKLMSKGWGLKRLGNKIMMELLKIAPMSVADFLNERFETDFLKAGLTLPAILGSFNGPWSSYTTFNLLLWEVAAQQQVLGGPMALINALKKSAQANGVEIRTKAEVSEILVNNLGRVEGVSLADGVQIKSSAVAASCNPKSVFLDLLAPNLIDHNLIFDVTNLRCRGTAAKISLALNQKIQWKTKPEKAIEYARTGNGFDQMEQAFDAVKYRHYSEKPVLDIFIPTTGNDALAPDGHEVVSILAHFAPYDLEGGWTDNRKRDFGDKVVEQMEKYTVALRESIVGIEILTPKDLESEYNLTGGDLFHGEQAIDQMIGRPIPSCVTYDTPIPGLYLCGSGSHPGGGLTCMPGMLASQGILQGSR